jgi:hypothetical protein
MPTATTNTNDVEADAWKGDICAKFVELCRQHLDDSNDGAKAMQEAFLDYVSKFPSKLPVSKANPKRKRKREEEKSSIDDTPPTPTTTNSIETLPPPSPSDPVPATAADANPEPEPEPEPDTTTIHEMVLHAKEMQGILYYVDKYDNMYHTQDVLDGVMNPRIVGRQGVISF